jgi:hypothetical protein
MTLFLPRNCTRGDLVTIVQSQVACWPKEKYGRFEATRTRKDRMEQALTEPGSTFRKAPPPAGGSLRLPTLGNGGQGPVTTSVVFLVLRFQLRDTDLALSEQKQ